MATSPEVAYRLAHRAALKQQFHPLRTAGAAGRWNPAGVFVTYCAEHPALAALEILIHAWQFPSLEGYRLFEVELNGDIAAVEAVDPGDLEQTRPTGARWEAAQNSPILRVPSVAASHSWNFLLSQRHPDFERLSWRDLGDFAFDTRLAEMHWRAWG